MITEYDEALAKAKSGRAMSSRDINVLIKSGRVEALMLLGVLNRGKK